MGLPETEYAEMTAEKVVTTYVRGFPRRVWTKAASARNEGLDCYVLALAAAHYAGVTRCNWDRLEAALIQPDMWQQPAPAAVVAPAAEASTEVDKPEPETGAATPPAPAPAPPRRVAPTVSPRMPRNNFATGWRR
jgi:phage terminase large subunit GpA-like protein